MKAQPAAPVAPVAPTASVAQPAAQVADVATATQVPVSNAINTDSKVEAPNQGNDYINSQIKAQVDQILAVAKQNPAQLQAALAQMSPDQVQALLKIPEVAAVINPILNKPSTNTAPTPVTAANSVDPAATNQVPQV
jgi:hypothetical protein